MDKDELKWITLTEDIGGRKLKWLVRKYKENHIPVRIQGGIRGPKIQVHDTDVLMALHFLDLQIGELHIATGDRTVTINDLHDNHEYFREYAVTPEMVEKLLDELLPPQEPINNMKKQPKEDLWDWDDQLPVPGEILAPNGEEIIGTLRNNIMTIPELGNGENMTIDMYDVSSSNMSQMGKYPLADDDPDNCVLLIRFKSNPNPYAYVPVRNDVWNTLFQEALKAERNEPDASVGGLFHALVKVDAESEKIKCYKLGDDNRWQPVLPRAKRVKDIKLQHGK